MKKTFKYIAAFVAFSAATLVSGLSVFGQNLDAGTYGESNGIGYVKSATLNNDGTYTIDLETFVTGEVTQTFESVPCDVVLVLDVSGSMDETIDEYVYTVYPHNNNITGGNNGWGNSNIKDTNPVVYVKYNNEYYQVYIGRGGNNYNRHYFLFFTVNGIRYHITTSGSIQTEEPTNVSGNYAYNTNLYPSNVDLYTRTTQSTGTTKMQALKAAVEAFIDQIAHNDWYEDDTDTKRRDAALGNQISIVKFGSASYNGSETEATITPGNHYQHLTYTRNQYTNNWTLTSSEYTTDYNEPIQTNTRIEYWYNCSEVRIGFTPTANAADVSSLKSSVTDLIASGATAADYGMNLAHMLINELGDDRANSSKTVVFFTDGAPTHGSEYDANVASAAITNSNSIKAITYGEGDDATHPTVYSVGVFSGTVTDQIRNFMTSVASGSDHFFNASGGSADDLKQIFKDIAHNAGGSGNTDVAGTSTLTVDVVSSSFTVPTDFEDASDEIEVLVAPCTGQTEIDGKKYLTFGAAKTPAEYGLDPITPDIDVDENKVTTIGFDYSEHWCGPDPTNTNPQSIQPYYHGFKQIIRFNITVKEDAVGGPAVATNDSDSGIYLPGATEPLVKFNRPTVKLPVQIWIQKNGLNEGDSAVFTLAMCKFSDWNPDETDLNNQKWTSFTKVVVNYSDMDENGIVKIVGLDGDYYYRLKEDAWAFGYTYQLGGVNYTVGDNVQNPFVFENKPKELKFDEASARNTFNERTSE